MLKKLMVTSACLLLGTTLAMAEGARFFKIDGSYTAGYKIQNDLQTPWTTEGQITQGSGNRSQQTVNQNLVLNLMAIKMMDGQKAPEFMVYSQIKLNPNDPDASSKSDDGELGADAAVDVGEAFILWKPHMALDVVLGRQTVLATMNSGHSFYGPAEFQVATLASTNTGSSGLTIAGYLGSPSHKAGISMLNGAPKVTDLYDAGKAGYSDQGAEKATIVWYEGGFLEKSALKVKVAQQTIAVAKSVTTSDDHITSYDESESHTVLNIFAKYDMGSIAPWIGYWSATGKTVGGGDIEATNTSIGLEMKDLGPGNLAFEYAMVSTPELGETGSAWAIIDLKSVMSLDYQIEMAKDIALTLTYRQLATGDYWTEGDGADFMGGAYAPALAWTPSTMMAMSINYKFK